MNGHKMEHNVRNKIKSKLLEMDNFLEESKKITEKLMFKMLNQEKELRTEKEQLVAELTTLKGIHAVVLEEQQYSQQQLQDLSVKVSNAIDEDLHNFCGLLGFQYSTTENNLENKAKGIVLHHDDSCFVKLEIGDGFYDLLEIQPPHPNFLQLRQNLQETRDIAGFLTTLRSYFQKSIE